MVAHTQFDVDNNTALRSASTPNAAPNLIRHLSCVSRNVNAMFRRFGLAVATHLIVGILAFSTASAQTINSPASLSVEEGQSVRFTISFNATRSSEKDLDFTSRIASSDTGIAFVRRIGSSVSCPGGRTTCTYSFEFEATGTVDDVVAGNRRTDIGVTFALANESGGCADCGRLPISLIIPVQVNDRDYGIVATSRGGSPTTITDSPVSSVAVAVVLSRAATANVTLQVMTDNSQILLSPARIVIPAARWNTVMNLRLMAVADMELDGHQTVPVSLVATSPDSNYDGISATFDVIVLDGDMAGFSLTPLDELPQLIEGGRETAIAAVLDAKPSSNVSLAFSISDTTAATLNTPTLTFTPANWNRAQEVEVSPIDDFMIDDVQEFDVVVNVAAGSDPAFIPLPLVTIMGAVLDDEVPQAITLTPTVATGIEGVNVWMTVNFRATNIDGGSLDFDTEISTGATGVRAKSIGSNTSCSFAAGTPRACSYQLLAYVRAENDHVNTGQRVIRATISVMLPSDSDICIDCTGIPFTSVIQVTIMDDDTAVAGFELEPNVVLPHLIEGGSATTITVGLTAQPTSDVILNFASTDATAVTLNPALLTFAPADFATRQEVVVYPVDDIALDGTQTVTISVSVDPGSDSAFVTVPAKSVTGEVGDDEIPQAIEIEPTSFSVVEGDRTFVTLRFSATNVEGSGLFFDFNTDTDLPDAVTAKRIGSNGACSTGVGPCFYEHFIVVKGVEDSLPIGDRDFTLTISVGLEPMQVCIDCTSLPAVLTVSGTVTDNDYGLLLLNADEIPVAVEEFYSSFDQLERSPDRVVSMSLALALPPSALVTVTVASDITEILALAETIQFSPANWDTPVVLHVLPVHDMEIDGDQNSDIVFTMTSSDSNYDGRQLTVSFVVSDIDVAGFTLDPNNSLAPISEGGAATSFSAVLDAMPSGNVVLDLMSSDTGEAMVSAGALTFSPSNWDVPKVVQVSPVDDILPDGQQPYMVLVSVASGSASEFSSLASQALGGVVEDDENPPPPQVVSLDPASVSVAEADATTVTVDFSAIAADGSLLDFLVNVTTSDPQVAQARVVESTNICPRGTVLCTYQRMIRIEAVDDTMPIGNRDFTTTISIALDPDPANPQCLDCTAIPTTLLVEGQVVEDDKGIVIVNAESLPSLFPEDGDPVTVSVRLSSAPTAAVNLMLATDASELNPSRSLLSFSTGNWNVAQQVMLTPVVDGIADGNQDVTVIFTAQSADTGFQSASATLDFVVTDTGQQAGISFIGAVPVPFNENSSPISVGVVLNRQPTTDVTLMASGQGDEYRIDADVLNFSIEDWNVAKMVQIDPVMDGLVDGNMNVTLSYAATSGDSAYQGVTASLAFVVNDSDTVATPAAITVSNRASLPGRVLESSPAVTVSVALARAPSAPVTVNVQVDRTELSPNASTKTFTILNWNLEQELVLNPVDDGLLDGDQSVTIILSASSGDSDYDSLVSRITIVVEDVTDPVTITRGAIPDTLVEGGEPAQVSFRLSAAPNEDVTVSFRVNDATEIGLSATMLEFTPSNWNQDQELTVSPVDDTITDGNQIVTFSYEVTSIDTRFTGGQTRRIVVNDNDTPGISFLDGESIVTQPGTVSEGGGVVNVFLSLSSQPASRVTLSVSIPTSPRMEISGQPVVFGPSDWNNAQSFGLNPIDNNDIDGDVTLQVSYTFTGPDPAYAAISLTFAITVVDDDFPGLVVEPSERERIGRGNTLVVMAVLSARPDSDVTVQMVVSNLILGEVTPQSVVIAPGEWNAQNRFELKVLGFETPSPDDYDFVLAADATSADTDFDGLTARVEVTSVSELFTQAAKQVVGEALGVIDGIGVSQLAMDLISEHLDDGGESQARLRLGTHELEGTWQVPLPRAVADDDPWAEGSDAGYSAVADLVPGSRFTLPLSDGRGNGPKVLWGGVGTMNLKGSLGAESDKIPYKGDVTSAHVGVSRRYVSGATYGISFAATHGELDLSGAERLSNVRRDLLSVHPYGHWRFSDGIESWVVIGYGDGNLTAVLADGQKSKSDASLFMAGGGLHKEVEVNDYELIASLEGYGSESKIEGNSELDGRNVSAWSGRAELELGRTYILESGMSLNPFGNIAFRRDAGDIGSEGGGEIGGGFRSESERGFQFGLETRLQFSDTQHQRRTLLGQLSYDLDDDRRGLSMSLNQEIEYTGVNSSSLDGRLGYGWGRTVLGKAGVYGPYLNLGSNSGDGKSALGFEFDARGLSVGVGREDGGVAIVYLNYVSVAK